MLVQSLILFTGIAGQLFVSQMNAVGFYFWLICNVIMVAVSYQLGSFGMCALYAFYGVMCVYSISKWKKLQTPK